MQGRDFVIFDELIEPKNERIDGEEVTLALNRILTSRPFRTSNQCCSLLRYIVERTLAGEDNLLRERVIGAELFGRRADYETSEDPVVRLRASDVRKRLAQYYLTDRDRQSVQIDIPPGSYRATFHRNTGASPEILARELGNVAPEAVAELNTVPSPEVEVLAIVSDAERKEDQRVERTPDKKRVGIAITAIALCILCVAGTLALIRANSPEKTFRAFWGPWITGAKPVIVSIGSNAVYRFQFEYLDQYAEQHGLKNAGQEFYVPLAKGQTVSADELLPAYNSFVALGDVAATSRIVATLTEGKKRYQERFPNDISFAELRDNPSILIGGFNNPMTMELTKQLEFVMRGGNEIIDTLDPKRKWQLEALKDLPDPPNTADYAIITRLVQRNGDAPFIGVAGLGQYGTLAAAELICSPKNIHLIADQLPKDWPDKNLQAVVRISIVDYKPTASEVVAYKSW